MRGLIAGHRRQRRSASRSRVSGRIDDWIRNALQKFVHPHAAFFAFDAGGGQIQIVKVRRAPRGMHHHFRFEAAWA